MAPEKKNELMHKIQLAVITLGTTMASACFYFLLRLHSTLPVMEKNIETHEVSITKLQAVDVGMQEEAKKLNERVVVLETRQGLK